MAVNFFDLHIIYPYVTLRGCRHIAVEKLNQWNILCKSSLERIRILLQTPISRTHGTSKLMVRIKMLLILIIMLTQSCRVLALLALVRCLLSDVGVVCCVLIRFYVRSACY